MLFSLANVYPFMYFKAQGRVEVNTMITTNYQRNDKSLWRVSEISGDYLRDSRLSYSNFLSVDRPSSFAFDGVRSSSADSCLANPTLSMPFWDGVRAVQGL